MNESNHEIYKIYKNSEKSYSEIFADVNMIITEFTHHCHECKTFFVSHNKLHDHICIKCKLLILSLSPTVSENSESTIIESRIKSKKLFRYSFRKWCYVIIRLYLANSIKIDESCLDFDCLIILINWKFLNLQNENMIILIKMISTSVRDFDQNKYDVTKFIQIMLNMSVKLNEKSVLLKLSCETHVVDNLSANMLIDTDTLDFHEIVINVVKSQIIMNIYQNTIINLLVKFKINHQTQSVYNK